MRREARKESRLPSSPWLMSVAEEGVKKGGQEGQRALAG